MRHIDGENLFRFGACSWRPPGNHRALTVLAKGIAFESISQAQKCAGWRAGAFVEFGAQIALLDDIDNRAA